MQIKFEEWITVCTECIRAPIPYRQVPGRTMWKHTSFCWELINLPGACVWSLGTYFNRSPFYHILFLEISYQARFCLWTGIISCNFIYNANQMLNSGRFIIHALLPGSSKVFILPVFLRAHTFKSFCRACTGMFENFQSLHSPHGGRGMAYHLSLLIEILKHHYGSPVVCVHVIESTSWPILAAAWL